ncbi:Malate/L-lactate dehydrogenase [Periconia macrospinosa]|uniref:Malate/L-lactate dehydrogenase n=1 Tax=Periconia macrospinosa TaxID=97972 RepID=A0A2V1DGJ5_9PLEO|nr:Malate/L-lactate dehydrogenase [Periconia macrospinosa]
MSTTNDQKLLNVTTPDARAFVEEVLIGNGVPRDNALIVAKCLVEADLRGVDTHGINRIPSYMARIRQSMLDAKASPSIRRISPAVAQVDGHNGFGFLAAHVAMLTAIEMANTTLGIGLVVAARGKVYKALRRGGKIPTGWALDKNGKPTDNPARALEGVMLPMGGPKGSALAVMMDVFSGVLSGSAFAGHVTNPIQEFKDRMDYLYNRVVGSDRMENVERIYFPGEIEQLTKEKRLKHGIPLVEAEIDALNKEAGQAGAGRTRASPPPTAARL